MQAYVWATPFVSMSALFEGMERDYGASLCRQVVFEHGEVGHPHEVKLAVVNQVQPFAQVLVPVFRTEGPTICLAWLEGQVRRAVDLKRANGLAV